MHEELSPHNNPRIILTSFELFEGVFVRLESVKMSGKQELECVCQDVFLSFLESSETA